jgi:hypothetical protein
VARTGTGSFGGKRRSAYCILQVTPSIPALSETVSMCLRSILSVLALSLFTTSAATAQTPEIIEKVERELALQRLQGVWVPDLLITPHGAEAYPLAGRALFFDGSAFGRVEGKRAIASGTFKVEDGFLRLAVTDKSPWDLEGADIRAKLQYAFKVDGDLLTLCYSVGDKGKPDDLSPGEGRQVVVYKRQRTDARATPGGR